MAYFFYQGAPQPIKQPQSIARIVCWLVYHTEPWWIKDDHFEVFSLARLVWPPNLLEGPDGEANVIEYAGMSPRVQELVYYMHYEYIGTSKVGCQFIDGNHGLKRLLSWKMDTSEPSATAPWTNLVPTITSKSNMIVRFVNDKNVVEKVRLLAGCELMLLMGWPRARLEELLEYKHTDLTKFAGAAFNGFSCVSIFSAAIYGAGLAGVTGETDQDLCTTYTEELALEIISDSNPPSKAKKRVAPQPKAASAAKPRALAKAPSSPHASSSSSD